MRADSPAFTFSRTCQPSTVLYSALQDSTLKYSTVQYSTGRSYTYSTVQCRSCSVQYSAEQYCATEFHGLLHSGATYRIQELHGGVGPGNGLSDLLQSLVLRCALQEAQAPESMHPQRTRRG